MDVFVEQVVTRKNRALREVLFYGAWVLLVACALIGLSGLMNVLYTGADGGLAFRPLAAGMAVVFLSGAFLLWRAALRLLRGGRGGLFRLKGRARGARFALAPLLARRG